MYGLVSKRGRVLHKGKSASGKMTAAQYLAHLTNLKMVPMCRRISWPERNLLVFDCTGFLGVGKKITVSFVVFSPS